MAEVDTMMDEGLGIRTRGLVKAYGSVRAVDGVDLAVRRGKCLGLVGPNGAGKTTLMRMLATLLEPTCGDASVMGHDIRHALRDVRQCMGYLPDFFNLYRDLTLSECLRLLGLIFIPHLIAFTAMAVSQWQDVVTAGLQAYFFGWPVRLLLLITAVVAYGAVWLYAGLYRRFRAERDPLFSYRGAVVFMAGFWVLIAGLTWQTLKGAPHLHLMVWILTAIVLLLLSLGASHPFDRYAESVSAGHPVPRLVSWRSNFGPSLVNLAIWVAAALWLLDGKSVLSPSRIVALASFWLILLMLVEATVVATPVLPYAKRLGWLLAFLYAVLPPLLDGMAGFDGVLAWYGPVSHLLMSAEVIESPGTISGVFATGSPWGVLVWNLALAILLGGFITRRYRSLTVRDEAP